MIRSNVMIRLISVCRIFIYIIPNVFHIYFNEKNVLIHRQKHCYMFCFDLDVFIFIDLFIRIDQRERERERKQQ